MSSQVKRKPGRPLQYNEPTSRISPLITHSDLVYMRKYVTPVTRAGKKMRPNGKAIRRMCERSRLLDAIEEALKCGESEVVDKVKWVVQDAEAVKSNA